MAEWQSIELADSDTLEALGKYGTEAVSGLGIALDILKGGAEVAKAFLLASVNPAAVAIVIAADEIISVLNQYKESGVSILIIDPFNLENGRKQPNKLGLKMKRDSIGVVFEVSRPHPVAPPTVISGLYEVNDAFRTSLNLADLDESYRDKNAQKKSDKGFIPPVPKLEYPYTFVQGGYDPATWSGSLQTVNTSSGVDAFGEEIPGIPFPELPADQTIEMMAAAFEDEGDIPKYEILPSVVSKSSQKYYDANGQEVTFENQQDKLKELRLELYGSANTKIATTERGVLTKRIATGRPEYTGDMGKKNFEVSALAIVVAAQNPLKFVESLSSIVSTLLPDHKELLKSMSAFSKATHTQTQNLTLRVDTKYGEFQKWDYIIGEKSGCIGRIREIVSQEDSVMTAVTVETNVVPETGPHPSPQPPLELIETTIDKNKDGRFIDVDIVWEPVGPSHPFGKFFPRENVFECEVTYSTYTLPSGQKGRYYNYYKKPPSSGWEQTAAAGYNLVGVLPKWSTVVAQSPVAEASTAPNFSSAKLAQMIPGYGAFFDDLINIAERMKAFAEGTLETIQKLIDVIDKAVEFFEELAANIIALIELLTQGIPNTGIWFMGMKTTSGNTGLASGLRGATDAPDSSYVFSSGILLVGPVMTGGKMEDMNKKLWEMLGIKFQSV